MSRVSLAGTLALLAFPLTAYAQVTPESTPSLPSVSDQLWIQNDYVRVTLPAATSGNTPLTYSVVGTLPNGVKFTPSVRRLFGTPSASQSAITYTYKVRDADGDEDTEEFTITVESDSLPALNATTADQHWIKDVAVSLTLPAASGGNAPLTYSLDGTPPTGVSFAAATRILSGTPSAFQSATTYTYRVRDANGDGLSDEFTIAVEADSTPSLAATADQSWAKDVAVSLTLPAANGGNSPLTYSLAGTLPTGVSFAAATRVLSGTPSALQSATTYTYKVRDGDGDEDTDEFTIDVVDTTPTLGSVSAQSWVQNVATAVTLPAASSGDAPLTYSVVGTLPTGVSFAASTRILSGTPSALQSAATYTYKVRDANDDEDTVEFTIEVIDTTPTLGSVSAQSWVRNVATSVTLPAASSGDAPLTYSVVGTLPTGVTFAASTRILSGTPTAQQNATTYTYKVRDANGDEDTAEFTIEVITATPSLSSVPDQIWVQSTQYRVTLPAATSGDAPLTYSVVGTLPNGVSFNATTRRLGGTPTAQQNATTYTYKVRDADGDEDSEQFTITVESNSHPSFTGTAADQTWIKDVAVSLTLPGASGGNAPLTYSLAGTLPTGVSFNASSRVLSGTPSALQNASTYTYRVRDANGDGLADEFTIAVETDSTPSLAASDLTWVKDVAVSLTLPAASGGNSPLTYSLIGSLPTNVSFNASTHVLSGTPTALQNATTYTYKVRDANNDEATAEFTIDVVDTTPTLGSVSAQSWVQNVATSVTLPAASSGDAPLTYSVVGTLPTGVTFAASTRILSGTPSALQNATTYTYKVRDANDDEATAEFTIEVIDTTPTLGSVSAQSWVRNVATSVTLPAASSGDAPLTYSVVGTLPTGVTFAASTRILSGTPSAQQSATTYTYKVRDANGDEDTAEFTIEVITATPSLGSVSDQSWARNVATSVTLPAASSGDAPLTYSVVGTLPTGVTFAASTRVLSGTPSVKQSATTYTYKVRDADGDEDTAEFTIEVISATPSLGSVSDQFWIQNFEARVTLPAATGGDAPLTYSVVGTLPTGVSFIPAVRRLSGAPSALQNATTYTYKVRDADGDEDSKQFTITVETDLHPILADTVDDQTWIKDVAVSLTLPAATSGNSPLTYRLPGTLPTGVSFAATTRILSGTPSALQNVTSYTYRVRDASGDEDIAPFTIAVEADTTPSLTASDLTWVKDVAVSITLPAASAGNSPLTYSLAGTLPTGVSFAAATRVLSGTPSALLTATTYTYKVTDANDDEDTDEFTIAVTNTTPSLGTVSAQSWVRGISKSLTLPEATSGDAPLTYSIVGTLPAGVSFAASTRILSGAPSTEQSATTYTYKVRDANDDEDTAEFTIAVTNATPTLGSASDQTWVQNVAASVTLPEATGGDAPLTYSVVGTLPTGVSFAASTRILSGTPSALQNATTYTYKVRDANGDEASDEFTIAVASDTTPSLAVTADQSWAKDVAVSLTLPAASGGNSPLTYSLAGTLPTGVSFAAATRILSGTPSVLQNATTYTYKVRDANGDEASDEFTVAVASDATPSLAATADQSWAKDVAVSLTLPAASGGNSPLTYSLAGTLPTGVSFAASTRILSGTPSAEQSAATYTYKVRDADGDEASDEFTIAVTDTTPTLSGTPDLSWVQGLANSVTLPAASGGDTPLTYSLAGLPSGVSFAAGARVLSGTASAAEQSATTYTYKVTDANGDEASDEFTLEITNATPTLSSVSDQAWVQNVAASVTLPAATGGDAPLTYSVVGSLPTGVNFTASTRILAGTPSALQNATTYTYKVRDANGDEDTAEFTIAVESDTTPSLAATADQSWAKDAAVSLTLPAASGGNSPLTYSLAGTLPTGVSFAASTRILSGTPSAEQSATTYTYKVRDADGDEASDEFTIAVTDTTPTLSGTPDLSWLKGKATSVTLPAASGGDSPLTYSLAGLPTGVSFDAATRVLSGGASTAEQSATTYTYKVTDANGDEATDEFTLEITNATPTLSGTSDVSWLKGTATSVTLPAASGGDAPLTYSLAGLPAGVSFAAATRVLSGTASMAEQSATTYTYKVTDANGDEATDEFTLEITNTTPTLSGTPDLSWLKGKATSVTLPAASGGDAPLTYSLAGLPTGVSFDAATRVLSGNASTAVQSATTYTYKVTDANGDEATDEFTLEMTNATPDLGSVSNQTWVQNIATSVTLPTATGGDAPLTYSIVGTLPTGVTFAALTRILSGTPSATQAPTTYTYKVRDANGDEDSESFTIDVAAAGTQSRELLFEPSRVTVPEGASIRYTVALSEAPGQAVTVAITRSGDSDLTFTPPSLTFSTNDWQTPKDVTVRASEDSDEIDGTARLIHTASSSGDFHGTTGVVNLSEVDNDRAESDASDPCASIPADMAPIKPLLEGIPFLPAGPSLTSGDKELRVRMPTARTDLAPVLAWNYKLDHYRTESKQGTWTRVPEAWLMNRSIPVNVRDSQAQSVVGGQPTTAADSHRMELLFSQGELAVARGGAASYTVRLATQPSSDVTVTVAAQSESDAGLTASPSHLTFSTSDWSRAQVVTIWATETEGAYRQASFEHVASGGGYADIAGQVTAHESNSGTKALAVSVDTLEVVEGNTVTYTLHLASRPDSEVALTIWRTGNADLRVDADPLTEDDQTTLMFTPANWNIPRTITVTAGQDENAVDETAMLEHELAGDGFGKRIGDLKNNSSFATCESVYLLTVQAVNRIGVSVFSTAVQATPTAETPVAPANLRAEPGPGQVTLSWSDPNDDAVTGYEYRYTTFSGTAGDSRGLSAWRAIDPTTSHVVKGARFGVRYTFEVRALQDDQRGAISRATAIPALAEPVSRKPTGFAAIWTNSGEARLQWDAEARNAGYEYRCSGDDGASWSEWLEAAPECDEASCDSTVTVEGNPEAYEFELRRASSDSASSIPTSPLEEDIARARTGTHPSAPKAPTLLSSTPEGPTPADRWELEWTATTEGESPTGWQYRSVYLGHRNGSLWTAWTDMQPSTDEGVFGFTVMIDDGEPKGQRMFQVRGTNALGVGEPSNVR